MIDSTFRSISRLFVISFKTGQNEPTTNSLVKYYIPLVEIKTFNALIANKPLFDQPGKTNKKDMKNLSRKR